MTQPTYIEAYEELKRIIRELEQGNISVDELSEKVKRAALLIAVCKTKLTETEEEVNRVIDSMEDNQ
jgi:exodeoxyribonuclease VII small subunit